MSTEKEKMLRGEYADTSDAELSASYARARKLWMELNSLPRESPAYRTTLRKLIPGIPDSSVVMTPFYCDHGHITVGENVFINLGCTFLDGGGISIGDHTLIGPSVQIYTPIHPKDYLERRKPIEYSPHVSIGSDCWIGGGAIILPGVTIGDRCIIGAGSVVTKDLPPDSFAAGNPAVVKSKTNKEK